MKVTLKNVSTMIVSLAMLLSGCATGSSTVSINKQETLSYEAEYPRMAEFPMYENYPDDNTYTKAMDAWYEDMLKQTEMAPGYHEGMNTYLVKSIREYLKDAGNSNLIYSPINVYSALAILAEITNGTSRKEILDVLGMKDIEELRTYMKGLWNSNYIDDEVNKQILGSSLWLRDDLTYHSEVLKVLKDNYYVSSYTGKMGTDVFDQKLQAWINSQTNDLLKESAGKLKMDPATIVSLVTTIYLKAKWTEEFDEVSNCSDEFTNADGTVTTDVEYMRSSDTHQYEWGDKFIAYTKEIGDNASRMHFILPDEGYTTDDILNDDEFMNYMLYRYQNKEWENNAMAMVNFKVPKFDVSSDIDLIEGMKNLGVKNVFGSDADFSSLSDEQAYLSACKHAARVKIDEQGVEAAAYTTMMVMAAAPADGEPVNITLNRPFLFVITGNEGLPLFVGTVNSIG